MSSPTHPIIISSDSDMEDTSSSPTVPVSPTIPSLAPSGDISAETEPFEDDETAPTPQIPPSVPVTSTLPSPPPVYGPLTYDQYLETQQWLSPDDVAPSPASSFRPPPYMLPSYVTPPVFTYHQTTTVPLPPSSGAIPDTVLPPRKRSFTILPSPSDPYAQAAAEASDRPKARRRVDARIWSFIPHTLSGWRYEEGTPSTYELGESSSMASARVLPVTQEPIHRTIPLLIARLVRHEDRLDRVCDHLHEIPLSRIGDLERDFALMLDGQGDIQQTVAGLGTTLDQTLEQVADLQGQLAQHQEDQYSSAADAHDEREVLRDRLEIAMTRIVELEERDAIRRDEIIELRESIQYERHMRGRLTDQRLLDRTRITTLEHTVEESQTRQRLTDDIIASLTRQIRELQCRSGIPPGGF